MLVHSPLLLAYFYHARLIGGALHLHCLNIWPRIVAQGNSFWKTSTKNLSTKNCQAILYHTSAMSTRKGSISRWE